MIGWRSGLYAGVVTHQRFRPKAHALSYRVFMLLLDLDELPALFARLRLLSKGRFGLVSFNVTDHGDRSERPLREQVEQRLVAAGIQGGGAIRLLCMPRVLGHGFNPLSVYFCHRPDGALAATLYEVSNTFGERHSYLIAAEPDAGGMLRQTAQKRFYVSPFMEMALRYRFTVQPPVAATRIVIAADDAEGPVLTAAFVGRRRPLSDAALLGAWLSHPLLTLKVVAGIHWEALKIWRKGMAFHRRPNLPDQPVTLGQSLSSPSRIVVEKEPLCVS